MLAYAEELPAPDARRQSSWRAMRSRAGAFAVLALEALSERGARVSVHRARQHAALHLAVDAGLREAEKTVHEVIPQ